jgi:signal transduction histidine kinase
MMHDSFDRDRSAWRAAGPSTGRHGHFVAIRRRRAWYFRRLAFIAVMLLLLIITTMFAAGWLFAGGGGRAGAAAALVTMLLLFGVLAVMVLVSGSMRRFGSPLHTVMDAADRVAAGDYGVRVPEYGAPPMRALARSFNAMIERLQSADRLRRNVMADVAHELRTPLTILQGRLEGLIDGVYARDDRQLTELLDETRVLSRLIEDLRTLALSDAGVLPLEKEPTDLVELVRDVVGSMRPEADRKSVSLDVASSIQERTVDCDPVRIREVLTNLLSNAVRHSAVGNSVIVSIADTNASIAVSVGDAGEGMSAEEVARMFDRFYKGEGSRGSGLGLAIAKSIVVGHGGDIKASSAPGKGTIVQFTLPR